MATEQASKQSEGLSLQTLVIAAVASGFAAIVVSHFWQGGTVLAAAMTPVIVSIVKEALRRPIESDIVRRSASKVSTVAIAPGRAVVGTGARTGSGRSVTRDLPPPPPSPVAPNGSGPPREAPHDIIHAGPRRTYGTSTTGRAWSIARLRGRPLKIAIVTGLLAFVVAVAVLTIPELLFGGAVSSGHGTTIFGGKSSSSKSDEKKGQSDQQKNDQGSTQPQGGTTQPSQTTPSQTTPSQTTPTQTQPSTPPPSSQPPSGGGSSPVPQTPAPAPPSP